MLVTNSKKLSLGLHVLLAWYLFTATPACACTVPVFRWALERWEADPYEVIVLHRGPLVLPDQGVVDRLEAAGQGDVTRANVAVHVVDLDSQPEEQMRVLWQVQPSSDLPWMMVRYPSVSVIEEDIWRGPLTDDAVGALLDSPKRRQIVERLLDGDAAVWVLLESGDAEKDDAAAQLLQAEINRMQKTLELPQSVTGSAYSGWNTPEPPDLPITFSLVRVSRTDPAEQMFVEMLLHSESDLSTFAEPIAFPVFGRGRVLYALVGTGINEGNIREACTFLVEACTCQVKAQSPGTDILMSVDWKTSIGEKLVTELALVPFPALSEVVGAGAAEPAGRESFVGAPSSTVLRNILLVAALLIVLVAAATMVLLVRKKRSVSSR